MRIDLLAERAWRIGGTSSRSISHVNELQTIGDHNEEFVDPDEMIRRLMEDNRHIAKLQRKAHVGCGEVEDVATVGILEDIVNQTERRTWFLYEILQDRDRFD